MQGELVDTEKTVAVDLDYGGCTACMACVELAPDFVEWNEDMDKPFLVIEEMPAALAQEVAAACPCDCFSFEGQS